MRAIFTAAILLVGCDHGTCPLAERQLMRVAVLVTAPGFDEAHPQEYAPLARDPFVRVERPSNPPPASQRTVAMHAYPINRAKVGGTADGMAMLVDPDGRGWNVQVGDLVGKDEEVGDRILNWRVARINGDRVHLSLGDTKSKVFRIGEK